MKRLEYYWYHPGFPTLLLLPLSYLYCSVVFVRRLLYRLSVFRQYRCAVPVIIVGNISVGGTGKTPLLMHLIAVLQAHGYRPGVVSRGYGGMAAKSLKTSALAVTKDSDPLQVGDEPVMIAQRCACPVRISPNRVLAVQALLAETDCDVIISDDGLQHYALQRDVEIAVIDGERHFGNGLCLPAGPLRERPNRLKSVDMLVINGAGKLDLASPIANRQFPMRLVMQDLRQVSQPDVCQSITVLQGQTVHAVAGIGNPQRFFEQLRSLSLNVIEHPFVDHYAYQAGDITFGDDLPVVMTEKDAVKCRTFATAHHWYVPVEAECDEQFDLQFVDRLEHMTSNRQRRDKDTSQ